MRGEGWRGQSPWPLCLLSPAHRQRGQAQDPEEHQTRLHRSVVPGLWNDILPRMETLPGPWKMTPLAHCAGSADPGLKGTSIKEQAPSP